MRDGAELKVKTNTKQTFIASWTCGPCNEAEGQPLPALATHTKESDSSREMSCDATVVEQTEAHQQSNLWTHGDSGTERAFENPPRLSQHPKCTCFDCCHRN